MSQHSNTGGRRPVPGRPVPKNLGASGRRGPRDYAAPEPSSVDDVDDFTQPNPKNPVAGAKPGLVIGTGLVVLGIIALVVFPFLPVNFPGWVTPALIGVIIFGIVVLFMQMPSKRSSASDGAQL